MPRGPEKKKFFNHDEGGEVPTITSLLGRKKAKLKTPTVSKPEMSLDLSQPIDLSQLQKEATDAGLKKLSNQPAHHPSIDEESDGDFWDTRGINRAVKQNEFARQKLANREKSQKVQIQLEAEVSPFSKPAEPTQARRTSSSPLPPPVAESGARVQPAPRRANRDAAKPITQWTMEMLKGGPDPLGKGLSILLEKGASSALFLAIAPPPSGSKIPYFGAAAATRTSREKLEIWTGLKWDPSAVPQVWNQILKSGFIELPHANAAHSATKNHNMIRAAFGMGNDGLLMLIRVGPVAACRGILAVFSEKSLLMELGPILTLFNTPLPLTAKTG